MNPNASVTKRLLSRAGFVLGAGLFAIGSLTGCAANGQGASQQWTLNFSDEHETGCDGTAAFTTGSDWAMSDDQLVQGTGTAVSVYCGKTDFYAQSIGKPAPELTVQDIATLLWDDGRCSSAPAVTISGQPGILCEQDASGNHFVEAMTIVGDTFIQIEGATPGDTGAVRTVVKSAVLTVN